MPVSTPGHPLINHALQLYRQKRPAAAAEVCKALLILAPQNSDVHALLGQIALDSGDSGAASAHFRAAWVADPENPQHALDSAFASLAFGQINEAQDILRSAVKRQPQCYSAWMMLGQIGEAMGDDRLAQRGFHRAITIAQGLGIWCDESSTPPSQLEAVLHALQCLRGIRRSNLFDSYEMVRQQHGNAALKRVDRALSAYLKEISADPDSPHQRPRFFFFPDLPAGPYHAPALHPWAKQLENAFPDIRHEALTVLATDGSFESYLRRASGAGIQDYLRNSAGIPSWEAFFFYRRGERYELHHQRCPITSQVLESIDLCRIDAEAPEICFSVLRPGTEILPHYGVTNLRLVMHLPLLIPPNCALRVLGGGEHHWQEGKTVLFDDTYRHEAWNRSDQSRVVLLMDCWNPYLTMPEREAMKLLLKAIRLSTLETAHEPT